MHSRQNRLLLTCAAGMLTISFPAQSSDAPVLGIELLPPAAVRITWTNTSVRPVLAYDVRSKAALDAAEWIDVEPVTPSASGVQSVELPVAPGAGATFYQVVAELWPSPTNMIWCPPGTFLMGSPDEEPGRFETEGPQTPVTISKGYWLGKYEVTQREYQAVTGLNPAYFSGSPDSPVERVTWEEAVSFCVSLTAQARAARQLPAGYEYRLPTEAQWEYACRAGTSDATAFGASLSSHQANFNGTQPYNGGAVGPDLMRTVPVGGYLGNAWGFHDMHGNVWEWCADWYSEALPGDSVTDPTGPLSGSTRVLRGGGFGDYGAACRAAVRYGHIPATRAAYLGFRVALTAVE